MDLVRARLLLGTANPAKVNRCRGYLVGLPVEVLSPADLGVVVGVAESGSTPAANAALKARAYCAASGLPALGIDAGLRIEGLPGDKQPGLFVRRVGGRDVPDEDVLAHYAGELAAIGGQAAGHWSVGLALALPGGSVFRDTFDLETRFTCARSAVVIPGEPLSSLMVDPASGRTYAEMAGEERPDGAWIRRFVEAHLDRLRRAEEDKGLVAGGGG